MSLRILHVISGIDPANGGPTQALLGLTAAQVRQGMDVTVAATWQQTAGRDNAQAFRREGVSVRMIGPALGALSRHPEIKPVLRKLIAASDVVHIHALWEEIQHQAARIRQQADKPYLIRPCGGLHPWSMARGRLKKRLYLALRLERNLQRAAAMHYTTKAERDAVAPFKLTAPSIVEPNGVDLREFAAVTRAQGRAFLAELLASRHITLGERKVVIFLGRLHPKKGLDVLVPAFIEAVRDSDRDALLLLAGPVQDSATAEFIHRTAAYAGMEQRIPVPGMLSRARRVLALAGADLFALTSYTENFGVSVVESLAAGCPVLISQGVEVQEQIAGGGVGEVLALDRAVIADALRRWLDDNALRQAAAQKARPFAAHNFDWNQIAARWREHYSRLLGK